MRNREEKRLGIGGLCEVRCRRCSRCSRFVRPCKSVGVTKCRSVVSVRLLATVTEGVFFFFLLGISCSV